MKTFVFLLLSIVFLFGCGKNDNKEKESQLQKASLDLREKNLDIREKELDIREKEIELREKQIQAEKEINDTHSENDILDYAFSSAIRSSIFDSLISDLVNLAAMAQQHYRKPTALGGGGGAFIGFEIPNNLTSTANGKYSIEEISDENIVLLGISHIKDYPPKVKMYISPNEITDVEKLN